MPSTDEAMVVDGRGRVQAYRPRELLRRGALALRALAGEWISSKKRIHEFSAVARAEKRRGLPRFLVDMRNRPPNRRSSDGQRLAEPQAIYTYTFTYLTRPA